MTMKEVLLVCILLIAVVKGYRLNNYYGPGFYTRTRSDGLASTQHMPLTYQEGIMVEADTGVNDHRNYGAYVYSRDGAGTYRDGGSRYFHKDGRRSFRMNDERRYMDSLYYNNNNYYGDRTYDRRQYDNYGGGYSPYYNNYNNYGYNSRYNDRRYGYGSGYGTNYDRSYNDYNSGYYSNGYGRGYGGVGIRARNDIAW